MCFMKEKAYQILLGKGSQRVKGSNKSHGHSSKYFKNKRYVQSDVTLVNEKHVTVDEIDPWSN